MANKKNWLGMPAMVLAFAIVGTANLAAQQAGTQIPAELRGTWVRTAATSGRAFDTTLTITANGMTFTYSDNRQAETFSLQSVEAISNTSEYPAFNRAQEFPSGWRLTGQENGREMNYAYFLNAAKNRFTQSGTDDARDIWVKQPVPKISRAVQDAK